jgi:hypothetical protein
MKRDITHADVEAFGAKFKEWAKGLSDKERVLADQMVDTAIRRSLGADGQLSDKELDKVAGGMAPVVEHTYRISGHPAYCC